MKALRNDQSAKKLETDLKKAAARENQLKAKEFAKKQRQIVKQKGVNGAKQSLNLGKSSSVHKDLIYQNNQSSNNQIVNITEIQSLSKISHAKENKSNNIIVELSDEGSSQAPSVKH
jgi:predicted membrane-bound mannosyltransferase